MKHDMKALSLVPKRSGVVPLIKPRCGMHVRLESVPLPSFGSLAMTGTMLQPHDDTVKSAAIVMRHDIWRLFAPYLTEGITDTSRS
jgi:hypothetical protein